MVFMGDISNPTIPAAIISAIGGILATWLTIRYGSKKFRAPKDRIDSIFDGYEKLIRQQQSDIDRKSKQLDNTQHVIDRLQMELNNTKDIITQQQQELILTKEANRSLIEQINILKSQGPQKL